MQHTLYIANNTAHSVNFAIKIWTRALSAQRGARVHFVILGASLITYFIEGQQADAATKLPQNLGAREQGWCTYFKWY